MFGNFIYVILVLLIYLTYPASEETNFTPSVSLLFCLLLSLAFAGFTRLSFNRIERRIARLGFVRSDTLFHSTQLRCSVLAVVVFALDVYGLSLPSFVSDLPLFSRVPTLPALLFLLLFMAHLGIVWALAFDVYRRLYQPDFGRREYVASHASFSMPALVPWLLISSLTDLINALPLQWPKAFLATNEGQLAYFCLVMLAISLMGPVMIQKFWRCTPLEEGRRRERIADICRRAGMGYANILYWPLFGGKMITAGVMGLIRKFRYILVTPALLDLLGPEEIDAVIAHEIGHIKKKHLVFYLLFFAGYLLVSYVAFDLILYTMLFVEPIWWLIHHSGLNQSTMASSVFSVLMIGVFLVYFRYVFGYFMRNFERQADTYVYTLFNSGVPLITTLQKIAFTSGQSYDRPNWHHFSVRERIDYLRKCEENPDWIRRQDGKIRRSVAVYAAALVCMGALGYQLNMGAVGSKLSSHLLEKIIVRQIERTPQNPALYSLQGDFNLSRMRYAEAKQAYEKALALKPDSPATLNNLAWLLATCDDERLRDPPQALELARRAARLEPSAYILDTLAQSYYSNGMYREAVQAEKRALELVKGDRSLYERQLQKFEEALNRP